MGSSGEEPLFIHASRGMKISHLLSRRHIHNSSCRLEHTRSRWGHDALPFRGNCSWNAQQSRGSWPWRLLVLCRCKQLSSPLWNSLRSAWSCWFYLGISQNCATFLCFLSWYLLWTSFQTCRALLRNTADRKSWTLVCFHRLKLSLWCFEIWNRLTFNFLPSGIFDLTFLY